MEPQFTKQDKDYSMEINLELHSYLYELMQQMHNKQSTMFEMLL